MKRSSFLKFLSIGSLVTVPFATPPRAQTKTRDPGGVKVDSGKDRFDHSISLFGGDTFFCKVSSKDTKGDLYVFEATRHLKGGPPLHYHFEQDEWWYILEGEFLFRIGEKNFEGKAGDSFFGPRLVPHAFAKTNDGPGRMLTLFQPAGRMEEHFTAISRGALTKLSEDEIDKFRQANGFKVVGPALTYDKSRNP